MVSQAQKEANKRYRQKNYDKVKLINNKSNQKSYDKCKDKFLVKSKLNYHKNRNYINIDNTIYKSLNTLFEI